MGIAGEGAAGFGWKAGITTCEIEAVSMKITNTLKHTRISSFDEWSQLSHRVLVAVVCQKTTLNEKWRRSWNKPEINPFDIFCNTLAILNIELSQLYDRVLVAVVCPKRALVLVEGQRETKGAIELNERRRRKSQAVPTHLQYKIY